jgi:hypothetical protein
MVLPNVCKKKSYSVQDLSFGDGGYDVVDTVPPSRGTCAEGDERTNKIVSAIAKSRIAAAVEILILS